MQPELFLLAPRHAGAAQVERRRTLLRRRADLLELVGSDDELPEELRLSAIQRMPLPDCPLHARGVWALPPSAILHATSEDIHEVSFHVDLACTLDELQDVFLWLSGACPCAITRCMARVSGPFRPVQPCMPL